MALTGKEIKLKIDQNNLEIELFLKPNQFVLNNKISELMQENASLQEQCPHNFQDGYCIYCYKVKE